MCGVVFVKSTETLQKKVTNANADNIWQSMWAADCGNVT